MCRNCYGRCHHDRYGMLHFVSDSFLFVMTGGLWGIRIYVREKRRR